MAYDKPCFVSLSKLYKYSIKKISTLEPSSLRANNDAEAITAEIPVTLSRFMSSSIAISIHWLCLGMGHWLGEGAYSRLTFVPHTIRDPTGTITPMQGVSTDGDVGGFNVPEPECI